MQKILIYSCQCYLLEYSNNYSIKSGGLWNYYRDKFDDVNATDNASDGKKIEYKTEIVGKTSERSGNKGDANQQLVPSLNVEVSFLKDLSNF